MKKHKRARSCERKRAFPSREAALRALRAVSKKAGSNFGQLEVYQCQRGCRVNDTAKKVWHFGHRIGTAKKR